MKKDTILYRFNFFNGQFSAWIWRLVCLVAIGFVGMHFEENPTVVSVVILFFAVVFCIISYEDILVFEDRFEYHDFSLFNRKSKMKVFLFSEIKVVKCRGLGDLGTVAVAFILRAALRSRSSERRSTLIDIETKDGKMEEIRISLDRVTSKHAVECIQKTMLEWKRKNK
jgi:hypothetical protein